MPQVQRSIQLPLARAREIHEKPVSNEKMMPVFESGLMLPSEDTFSGHKRFAEVAGWTYTSEFQQISCGVETNTPRIVVQQYHSLGPYSVERVQRAFGGQFILQFAHVYGYLNAIEPEGKWLLFYVRNKDKISPITADGIKSGWHLDAPKVLPRFKWPDYRTIVSR